MPTFNYQCKKCSNTQEEFHGIKAMPQIQCCICNSECEKMFSPNTNFILKGDGFPSRDYRMKKDMTKKNSKMKNTMKERENSGEGATSLKDIPKNL